MYPPAALPVVPGVDRNATTADITARRARRQSVLRWGSETAQSKHVKGGIQMAKKAAKGGKKKAAKKR